MTCEFFCLSFLRCFLSLIVTWPQVTRLILEHTPWAFYQIRKIVGCACAGNAGNVFPCRRFQRKPLVGDPGMHYGTCVTHVPWCMSGSLTCGEGENVPGIPGACAPAILRIWQEAHCSHSVGLLMSPYISISLAGDAMGARGIEHIIYWYTDCRLPFAQMVYILQ